MNPLAQSLTSLGGPAWLELLSVSSERRTKQAQQEGRQATGRSGSESQQDEGGRSAQ